STAYLADRAGTKAMFSHHAQNVVDLPGRDLSMPPWICFEVFPAGINVCFHIFLCRVDCWTALLCDVSLASINENGQLFLLPLWLYGVPSHQPQAQNGRAAHNWRPKTCLRSRVRVCCFQRRC